MPERTHVVVGSINMDLVTGVEAIPRPGETVRGTDYRTHPGGKGANQAVAMARLGAAVRFVGRVGSDAFGESLRRGLDEAGIDVAAVEVVPGASGVAFITVEPGGENTIVVSPGANDALRPEGLSAATFEGAEVAVFQLELPLETVARGLDLAHGAGVRTVLNAAPMRGGLDALLRRVDVLVVNEGEAAALLGVPEAELEPEAALAGLVRSGGAVVITLGRRGAVWRAGTETGRQEAFAVEAIDATGAGDTFVGALATELGRGCGWPEAVATACAAAAVCVTRPGAQPSIPTRAEVEALLAATERR